jgi:hypothetical protein
MMAFKDFTLERRRLPFGLAPLCGSRSLASGPAGQRIAPSQHQVFPIGILHHGYFDCIAHGQCLPAARQLTRSKKATALTIVA